MLSVLAAAAMVLPETGNAFERRVVSDLPREVMESNLVGAWYRVFVTAEGEIVQCRIIAVDGDGSEADAVCDTMMGRRIAPARDAEGRPIASYARGVISLVNLQKGHRRAKVAPDFAMTIDRMPEGVEPPVWREMVAEVDGEGRIAQCRDEEDGEDISAAICASLIGAEMPVHRAEDGSAITYLIPLTVRLDEGQG